MLPTWGGAPRLPCYIMANIFREAKVESKGSWCEWILLGKQLADHKQNNVWRYVLLPKSRWQILAISQQTSAWSQIITNVGIPSLPLTGFFFDQRILINQSENFQVTGGTNFSGNKTLYFKKGVTESLDVVTVLSQFNFRNKTQINQTEVWFQKRNSNKANRCQLLWTEDKKPLKP